MQINRLFEIVYLLLQKKCLTAGELAEHFEVSTRTIYRDVERLSMSGIPVYMQKGRSGGISLLPDYVLDKAVLSREEKEEVISSLQAVEQVWEGKKSEALKRLSSLFGEAGTDWLEIDFSDWTDRTGEKATFELLRQAVIHRQAVSFTYVNGKGESTRRTVLPLKLCFKAQAWYLYGECRLRQEERFFKLKRIRELSLTGETFERKVPARVLEEQSYAGKEKIVLRLLISEDLAWRVYDEFDQYEKMPDGSFLCELSMPEGEWMFGYLATFGEKCEILSPQEIKEEMRERIHRWAASLDRI